LKIGFIGYGSMGRMIINGLLDAGAIDINNIIISTRSKEKLNGLKLQYPQIEILEDNISLSEKSDKIFLFVNTGEIKNVIDEIKDHVSKDMHIIHISAGLSMEILETVFQGKITRVIPSLTSEVGEGVSLICHNQKVTIPEKKFVEYLFEYISKVKVISENDFEIASDLTSCAPAFIAQIMMLFANAGSDKSGFSKKEAEDMIIQTLYGTAKLLAEKEMSFEEIISRVATKGGITEEGIKVLEKELPSVFHDLFEKTLDKHQKVKENLKSQYS
jgi:pyrroline-5-carboxylate reductase